VSHDETPGPPGNLGSTAGASPEVTEAPADAASGVAPPPPPWPLPPPVRRPVWPWILGALGSILIVASMVASFVQLPYYTIAPGDALDVNRLVTVHGARRYPPKGAVMLLFIRERSRVNAWRWIQAALDPEIDLVKQRQFAGDADPAEVDAQAVADMTISQNSAKYVALRRLGYKVGVVQRVSVLAVIAGRPAAGVLRPGDTIVGIDGTSVSTPAELMKVMSAHHRGERVSIRYLRGGRQSVASIRVAGDKGGHPVIGVYLSRPFKFPLDVRIDTSDIGGPSAGLAMTLSILDELTPGELTGAKRVAVTGQIDTDGRVLPVGGVGQKAVAARHRGAQLFLVPMGEVAEARGRAGSMPVVGVRNLDDALRALHSAGGDPLPPLRNRAAA
jgi:PDZ domain-containing protein